MAADDLVVTSLDSLCGGDGLRSLGLFAFILLRGGGEGLILHFRSPFLNLWGGGEGLILRFLSPFLNIWGGGGEGLHNQCPPLTR